MKTPHLQACDIVDQLDELVRMRGAYRFNESWQGNVRKLLAELRAKLVEADREVGDAFDAKRTRWGIKSKPCAWCGGPMPTNARSDATTCSKRCRQAKSRGGTGRKVRLWPKGIRTARPAGRATDATDDSTDVGATPATPATASELVKRRGRRAQLGPDDWRSPERRANREQLCITAPPIGAQPHEDSDGE